MRRATALLIALTLSAGLASLGARTIPPRPRQVAGTPAIQVAMLAGSVAVVTTAPPPTTTTEPPTTTTTAPPPTTTTPPTTAAPIRTVTTTPATTPVRVAVRAGPGGTGDLLSCLRWFESNDGVDPNLYQFDSSTWAAAFDAAVAQGLIPALTPYTSAAGAERWVQNAAAQAWIAAGHLVSGWRAQQGRCF